MNVNNKKLTNPIKVEDLKDFITKAKEAEHNLIELEHAVSQIYHFLVHGSVFFLVVCNIMLVENVF